MIRRSLRHGLTAALLLVGMLSQGTWALASTTGGLAGYVLDADSSAPIAGATVTATAPSQTATATTDAAGHFTFLTLGPDTYTVTA
ncbi:MAG: carboxypeptidase regulatory-like domain-containing protein, partial [Candidatus Eremiobacteraeota bacterium]|nr:carboxypeptidase regulatory-like domain-containing protein [Candidatus Eremiobacteraeota bacterium]